jgi:hypothetical protein
MIEPAGPERQTTTPQPMTAVEFNTDVAACGQCNIAPRCFCAKHLAMAPSVTS